MLADCDVTALHMSVDGPFQTVVPENAKKVNQLVRSFVRSYNTITSLYISCYMASITSKTDILIRQDATEIPAFIILGDSNYDSELSSEDEI